MTTNVYDVAAGLLTSDSRWSADEGEWIVYVDDTGFDKIIADAQLAFLFAGNILNIAEWKGWVKSGRLQPAPLDRLDGTSLIMVEIATGSVVFGTDYLLVSRYDAMPSAWYSGTGAPHAKDCWEVNRCAMTAVASATKVDKYSGGTTSHFNRNSRASNVTNSAAVESVLVQMRERGIMKNNNGAEFMISDVIAADAANDPASKQIDDVAKRLAQKVMQGNVTLSAPFPGIDQPWTNEKKSELARVLARYAPAQA